MSNWAHSSHDTFHPSLNPNAAGHAIPASVASTRLESGAAVGVEASTTLELDSEFAQQTKRSIRAAILEITGLSRRRLTPARYYAGLLSKLTAAMTASGAAFWLERADGTWQLVGDYRLADALVEPNEIDDLESSELLRSDFDTTQFSSSHEDQIASTLDGISDQVDRALRVDAAGDRQTSADGLSSRLQMAAQQAELAYHQLARQQISPPQTDSSENRPEAEQAESEATPNPVEPGDAESNPFYVPVLYRPSASHASILNCVAKERQPILVPPGGTRLSSDRPENPTEDFLIFAPVPYDSSAGQLWLQVIQPATGGPTTQRGFLRFVAQIADLTAEYLRSHRLQFLESQQASLETLERLLSELPLLPNANQRQHELLKTAARTASCEQLFLVMRRSASSRWQVVGASDVTVVDANADGIQAAVASVKHLTARSSVSNPSENQNNASIQTWGMNLADAGMSPLDTLLDLFQCAAGALIRLDGHREPSSPMHVCLVGVWADKRSLEERQSVPESTDAPTSETIISRPQLVRLQTMLRLGLSASQVGWWQQFNLPLNSLRRTMRPVSWRRPVQAFVLGSLAGVIAFIPVPLRVESIGTLHPLRPQQFYSPTTARIESVLVDYGQAVVAGQPLLQLVDRELDERIENLSGQLATAEEQLREIDSRLRRSSELTSAERDALEGQRETLSQTMAIRQEKRRIMDGQREELTIRASAKGVVNTWNARRDLLDMTVGPGTLLLTVHDPEDDWIVETNVAEHDVAAVQQTINDHHADVHNATRSSRDFTHDTPIEKPLGPQAVSAELLGEGDSAPRLNATVFLATHPTEPITATLSRTDASLVRDNASASSSMAASASIGNGAASASSWRMQFRIPADALPDRSDGAVARVSIENGRTPLIWALTRDLVTSTYTRLRMWL